MLSFFKKVYDSFVIARLIYKKGIGSLLRDPLTEVYDRKLLEEFGEREIRRAGRHKGHLYCIMADIDNLKIINDEKKDGHLEGDKALKTVASVLKENSRETDLIFRYGGDEFLILMSETFKLGVEAFRERVAKKLYEFSLTVSMGSYFWKKGMTLNELIKKADERLYRAKKLRKKKPEEI